MTVLGLWNFIAFCFPVKLCFVWYLVWYAVILWFVIFIISLRLRLLKGLISCGLGLSYIPLACWPFLTTSSAVSGNSAGFTLGTVLIIFRWSVSSLWALGLAGFLEIEFECRPLLFSYYECWLLSWYMHDTFQSPSPTNCIKKTIIINIWTDK